MQYGNGEYLEASGGNRNSAVVFAEEHPSRPLFYAMLCVLCYKRCNCRSYQGFLLPELLRETDTVSLFTFIIRFFLLFKDTKSLEKTSRSVLSAGHICCPSAKTNRWLSTIASRLRKKDSVFLQMRHRWHQTKIFIHVISFILFDKAARAPRFFATLFPTKRQGKRGTFPSPSKSSFFPLAENSQFFWRRKGSESRPLREPKKGEIRRHGFAAGNSKAGSCGGNLSSYLCWKFVF